MSPVRGILGEIAEKVSARMRDRQALVSMEQLRGRLSKTRVPLDFTLPFALNLEARPNVIAEIKFASPSLGRIVSVSEDPVEVARAYLRSGAAALSVLTEEDYFGGSSENLKSVRAAFPEAFILKKDFVLDEYQLLEARYEGADAILLIAALVSPVQLRHLFSLALDMGLTPLVEVHDEPELNQAIELGARLIGINNRNLKTMETDLQTSVDLISLAPEGALFISESGISQFSEIRNLSERGFSGFLVGGALMSEPGARLAELLSP